MRCARRSRSIRSQALRSKRSSATPMRRRPRCSRASTTRSSRRGRCYCSASISADAGLWSGRALPHRSLPLVEACGGDRERGTTRTAFEAYLQTPPAVSWLGAGTYFPLCAFVAAPLPVPAPQGGREPCGAHLRNSRDVCADGLLSMWRYAQILFRNLRLQRLLHGAIERVGGARGRLLALIGHVGVALLDQIGHATVEGRALRCLPIHMRLSFAR